MGDSRHYVIRGGMQGRERLRILGRVMHPTTAALFDRVGVQGELACLDVGCGGGDVTLALARRVAPSGRVLGLDIDQAKLDLATAEAEEQGLTNVEFRHSDVRDGVHESEFDVVYSRFLLTHLSDPEEVVRAFYRAVGSGGLVVVEDIDFSGYFTHPECPAFRRFLELYCATVTRRGGDPNMGQRLPGLLRRAGLEGVGMCVVQPIATEGDAKLVNPLTMENIADAVLEDDLATREEIDQVVRDLYDFAADPETLAGVPRVIQAWGRRPTATVH
jgi:SAM-dependent methyltransferase